MSKYKVGFLVNSNANAFSTTAEVIDLINDYSYSEEWLWETIETNYKVLKTDQETEEWKGLND